MSTSLEPLLADGVIDEVVARLRGGKEADIWLVRHAGELVTAKVYKDRLVRSFKNDAAYREGRQVRNTRTQRAMDRGSRFGQAAAADAWKLKESDALHRLHAAGLRVPRPVMYYEGVLLMELVVDAQGHPAPRLVEAGVAPEAAAQVYAELRKQLIGMLACDLIHGDLSPYNVLVDATGPVVIDFPQVIDAAQNSQAERFLLRDLQNVYEFCAALDPALRAAEGDGREIWRAYVRRELTPDFVPTGRPPPERRPHEGGRDGHGRRHGQERRPGGPGGRPGGERPHDHRAPPAQHAAPRAAAPAPAPGGSRGPESRRPDSRPDPRRQDARRQDPQRQDPRRQDARGQDPQRQEPRRQDARGQDPQRQDPRRQDARRQDPRGRRATSMPEVIRIERPLQGGPGPGAQGGRPGGQGAQGGRPAAQGGRPAAQGGRPAAQGGRPAAQGGRPAAQGDAAIRGGGPGGRPGHHHRRWR